MTPFDRLRVASNTVHIHVLNLAQLLSLAFLDAEFLSLSGLLHARSPKIGVF